MSKKKILVVTGSRAEYGLLKSTLKEIISSKKLTLKLLVTGMHTLKRYGLTLNEIKKDGFKIAAVVKINESDDMLMALVKEIEGIRKYCLKNKPVLILVLGDRDEPFAAAIVGGHLKIPIAHIHGGDLSRATVDGAIRQSITKFAHLHFTVCQSSYQKVIKLQEEPRRAFMVGAPGLDNIDKSQLLTKAQLSKKLKINPNKKWLLFIMHPAPFEKIPFKLQIQNPLKSIGQLKDYEKIIVYPNSDTGSNIFINEINKLKNKKSFYIFKHLDREIYLSVLNNIEFLIGNSSSGIIETTFLKLPTINIGNRQKGRERGRNILDTSYHPTAIKSAVKKVTSQAFKNNVKKAKNPYGHGTAGKKIVKIIENNINKKELFYKKDTY